MRTALWKRHFCRAWSGGRKRCGLSSKNRRASHIEHWLYIGMRSSVMINKSGRCCGSWTVGKHVLTSVRIVVVSITKGLSNVIMKQWQGDYCVDPTRENSNSSVKALPFSSELVPSNLSIIPISTIYTF